MSEVAVAVETAAPSPPAGEPTIESLTALIPDSAVLAEPAPSVDSSASPGADRTDVPAVPAEAAPAEAPAEAAAPAPDAVDKEALERAEAAARRAREGSRRYREMQEAQRRQAADMQRQAEEVRRAAAEAEQARRFQQELAKDPYAALKKLGMTDQDLAERALREGTPEAALARFQEEIRAEREARLALERQIQAEREEMSRHQAEQKFFKVADNEESYPRLAQLNSSAQLAVVRAALQQIANNGYDVAGLSDEQVAEACEKFLAPKKGGKSAALSSGANLKPPAPKPAAKTGSTTLTNAVSTTKAVASRPWHELTEDEQIAQIAAAMPDPI